MRVPDPQPGRFSVASVSGSRAYATRRPRRRAPRPLPQSGRALRGTGSTRLPRARPSTGPARPGPAGLGVGQGSKRTREGSLQQPFLRLSPLAPAASQSCVPSQARPPGRPHSRSGCGGGGRRRIWCGQFRRHFGGDAKHGTVKGLASAEAPEAPDPAHRHPHPCPAHPPEPSPAHPPRCRIRTCGWGGGRTCGRAAAARGVRSGGGSGVGRAARRADMRADGARTRAPHRRGWPLAMARRGEREGGGGEGAGQGR